MESMWVVETSMEWTMDDLLVVVVQLLKVLESEPTDLEVPQA